ncbi:GDYXXLXY domain-containing protein [Egbenema bharatensis]|uniref:GDYXXLXY domain-containing protein n=1 Tax=Egbenema bharatensis TaxID=3463334 RepID=UPI003A87661B
MTAQDPQLPSQPTQPPIELPTPDTRLPTPSSRQPLPPWRLWIPLLVQVVLIIAVPARDAYTYVAGRSITLQTAPVDPYDILRGYYQTLSYDVSNVETLRSLPGGDWFNQYQEQPLSFYVVLEPPAQANATPPQPWTPVRISGDRPTDLTPNQVAMQGQYDGWSITYGLETYYMPESRREEINADINQVQWEEREAFVVDVKVDRGGNAVPISLWVRDRNYRF